MAAVYLTVCGLLAIAPMRLQAQDAQKPASTADPDDLYRNRADIDSAKRAADIWAARAAGGADYEASWKLARACYYLGTAGPDADQRAQLERGIAAGKQAATLEAGKPDGHFWYAATMGALAQFGMGPGMKYRGDIRDQLQIVIAMQPGWQEGSAESALGQWYDKVPWLFGGRHEKAVEWLRKALTYNSQSSQARYTLAEVLAEESKTAPEARTLLQQVIDAAVDPEWAAEDRLFKSRAAALLAKLNKK